MSTAIPLFALWSDGKEYPVKLQKGKLLWLGGCVGKGVPIRVRGRTKKARKLCDRIRKKGYQVKLMAPKKAKPRMVKAAQTPITPEERPWCPKCRERDKVVLPSDPLPEKKWFQEPYCTRCKGTLSTLPRHPLLSFDPDF